MKQMLPFSLRTHKSEQAYQEAKLAKSTRALKDEPAITTYTYWRLLKNRFPYDLAYGIHDMLVPIRIFADRTQITPDESREMDWIIESLKGKYNIIFENIGSNRSVSDHYHIHLAKFHTDRSRMDKYAN